MKIIVSHDVDHISSYEHYRDLIIPKYIARATLEFVNRQIGLPEYSLRLAHTLSGKWNFIKELSDFNKEKGIQSTFFFATSKGIGLSYRPHIAKPMLDYVVSSGHKVGIHGIERDNLIEIQRERRVFEQEYGQACSGIRLHYLASKKEQLIKLSKAGYIYDSSMRGEAGISTINNMTFFPLHTMDGDIILSSKRQQCVNYKKAIDLTIEKISRSVDNQVDYYSLLFHDRYFSDANKTWKMWYIGIIEWLIEQKFEFTTYEDVAIRLQEKN